MLRVLSRSVRPLRCLLGGAELTQPSGTWLPRPRTPLTRNTARDVERSSLDRQPSAAIADGHPYCRFPSNPGPLSLGAWIRSGRLSRNDLMGTVVLAAYSSARASLSTRQEPQERATARASPRLAVESATPNWVSLHKSIRFSAGYTNRGAHPSDRHRGRGTNPDGSLSHPGQSLGP